MMKRFWYVAVGLLLLVCTLAFIQIIVDYGLHQDVKAQFVSALYNSAKSTSVNIGHILKGSDEELNESMTGTRIYLDMMANTFRIQPLSFRYNILFYKYDFFEELNRDGYMTITFIQDKYEIIFQKHLNGGKLDNSDLAYLTELKTALDKLCNSLQNEDGSLKREAIKKTYFAEQFNKFIASMYM